MESSNYCYAPETNGVCICYCSVYQNTAEACKYLYNKLKEENTNIEIFDLARTEGSYVLEGAFKYSKLVLASPTYNTIVIGSTGIREPTTHCYY
ncbi:uncharacterized flavoproteins [Clostridium sp. CAG:307]|nr:uncharacterized flavoproteins [Clostridium sp. CAG:307]